MRKTIWLTQEVKSKLSWTSSKSTTPTKTAMSNIISYGLWLNAFSGKAGVREGGPLPLLLVHNKQKILVIIVMHEDIGMINKHIQEYSTLLVIRETAVKITMKYH